MELFDKIGKKASQTYKYTTEKTNKIAKEAKLKMSMSENKSKIDSIYEKIGKSIYEYHISNETRDNEKIEKIIEEYCIEIDEISDNIEVQRKEILMLRDKKQCENCYCEIDSNDNFCPNCGLRQDVEEAEDFIGNVEEKEE